MRDEIKTAAQDGNPAATVIQITNTPILLKRRIAEMAMAQLGAKFDGRMVRRWAFPWLAEDTWYYAALTPALTIEVEDYYGRPVTNIPLRFPWED